MVSRKVKISTLHQSLQSNCKLVTPFKNYKELKELLRFRKTALTLRCAALTLVCGAITLLLKKELKVPARCIGNPWGKSRTIQPSPDDWSFSRQSNWPARAGGNLNLFQGLHTKYFEKGTVSARLTWLIPTSVFAALLIFWGRPISPKPVVLLLQTIGAHPLVVAVIKSRA